MSSTNPDRAAKEILEVEIEDELAESFLSYSLSVITSRAIPDVRDGLKPVQRRLLYGLHTQGLRPDVQYKKSARLVGEVLGKYHPHGDSACYEALVRMAQDFSMRVPLVDGQGNFGSPDDGPAAMRYCVTGDTRVALPDGTSIRIDQLAADAEPCSETDIDVKVLDWRGNPVRAEKAFHSGTHPTKRVTVDGGLQLRGTANHPVLTLAAPAGVPMFQWRLLGELGPGEYIALDRASRLGRPAARAEKHLAVLAGMMVAEGWASVSRCGFNNCDEGYFDAAVDAWDAVVGATRYVYSRVLPSGKTIWELDCQTAGALEGGPLAELIGLRSAEKRIPESIWSLPAAAKALFLSALYEGDGGTATAPRGSAMVYYSTRSERLARDVVAMLLELGIIGRTYHNEISGEWAVHISNAAEIRRFASIIGFQFAKREVMDQVLGHLPSTPRGRNGDTIPFVAEYLRQEAGRGNRKWLSKHDLTASRVWANSADELLGLVNNAEAVDVVHPIVTSGFRFAKVTCVEDAGEAEVYSIRVDSDDHSFIAGRFINHNTECRMDSAALDMLAELDEETVNWAPNYDNTESEPTVLPSSLPNLLINGATGIAVGMATNLAPHNPSEVLAAARHLLHHPDATLDDVMEIVPAPDFPTGGILVDAGGVREAYETGRGAFKVRGATEITQVSQRRRGIVITELPYTVGPERFIAKVKSLVTDKTLDGISDIIDLSDRKHGLRVVVEVKASASAEAVLAELYKRTPLEDGFSINAVALVDGQPRTLGIVEMLKAWLAHRLEVLLRRTAHRLAKAEARAHIVEGLVLALARIEEVVALIRSSESTAEAREALMANLALSEIQANHILEMPLRRLTSLEAQKLTDELAELRETIEYLNRLLTDTDEQTSVLDGEIANMEARHGSARRTRILGADEAVIDIPEGGAANSEPCAVWLSATGTVGRTNPDDTAPKRPAAADIVVSVADCTGETDVWAVCDTGRLLGAHPNLVAPIEGRSRGGRIEDLFELDRGENVVAVIGDRNLAAGTLVVVTANGVIKRLDGTQLPGRLPSQVIGLKDGDRVVAAFVASDDTDAVMVASSGQVLRTPTGPVRAQGRSAGGVTGMRLGDDHQIIAAGPAVEGAVVCIATDSGAVKTTPVTEYPSKGRGGQGVRGVRLRSGETSVVAAAVVTGPVGVAGSTKITLEGSAGKRDGAAVALDTAPERFGWVRASV